MLTRCGVGEKKRGALAADVKRILLIGGVRERRNIDAACAICDLFDETARDGAAEAQHLCPGSAAP
jgi:hypothetical protein